MIAALLLAGGGAGVGLWLAVRDGHLDDGRDWGLEVDAADNAFAGEVSPSVRPADGGQQGPPTAASRSPAFEVSAEGVQPRRPLEVRRPLNHGLDDPGMAFLARWDEQSQRWHPLETRIDAERDMLAARVDHLSTFRFFEWEPWEDASSRVRLTADEVAELAEGAKDTATGAATRVEEGFDALTEGVTGWLGVDGARPPECLRSPDDLELSVSPDGEQPPLQACVDAGDEPASATLRVANNRPYGMVLSVPSGASTTLQSWPGAEIDSGQGAVLGFYEALDDHTQSTRSYVPPGATVTVSLDLSGDTEVNAEATSTPALVGLDLAAELGKALWLSAPDAVVDSLDCLLSGGRGLEAALDEPGPAEVGGMLASVEHCFDAAEVDIGQDVVGVARSTLAAGASLSSHIRDTDWRRFEVVVDLTVERIDDAGPEGFVEFRDEEAGFAIRHPEGWDRRSPEDEHVRLLVTPNDRDSIMVRVAPIERDELDDEIDEEITEEDVSALHGFTEEIVRDAEGAEVLAGPEPVQLAGTVGSYYLYTFEDGTGPGRGVHARYFLFEKDRMITLVLQTVPPERFSELADVFDVVAESLELLE